MARKISNRRRVIMTVIAWALAFVIFFPILWTIILSFKTEGNAIKAPWDVLTSAWTFDSYNVVQERSNYFRHFMNSVVISFGSTLLALVIAIPSALAMAFVPGKRT
jgi:sorbitol/mannitol transport system permease protein